MEAVINCHSVILLLAAHFIVQVAIITSWTALFVCVLLYKLKSSMCSPWRVVWCGGDACLCGGGGAQLGLSDDPGLCVEGQAAEKT